MKNITTLILLLLPSLLFSQLKINELMSNNVSAVMDDAYNYSMWVELYNTSTTNAYNQTNYYLTDNLSEPKKWKPSSRIIPTQGYSVIWFERSDRAGHAQFKLDPEGGKLYLLNSQSEVIDAVEYPAQYRNVSYGRVTDGDEDWVYFSEYSNGTSNNDKKWTAKRCKKPIFDKSGGFYPSPININFDVLADAKDTIYYTTDGIEPTRSSKQYTGNATRITKTTYVRARSFSSNKLPSDVVTATYFISQRKINLPVVSIVTEQKNLTDNTVGIYVKGTNGIPGNGTGENVNWNQDWDRPANFELFDKDGKVCLNQELDIAISGGWSRTMFPQKSLKIQPRKKFGDNRLRYDIFAATKPNHKYKDIQLRNSGNDFGQTMLRDAFMHSLVVNRMNIDYLAYEPAVCFINGQYYGIQNLRERSNEDYIYSNYGLDEEDISLIDHTQVYTKPFSDLTSFVSNNNVSITTVYKQVEEMMDVDNFIDYFIAEIFYADTDWPHNNLKVWKKKENGKWKWIMYDTDFGFGDPWHNTLTYALNATDKNNNNSRVPSSIILSRLMTNTTFKNKFIDRFCIHVSSTYEEKRVNHILDSLANRIAGEMTYHYQKWGGGDFQGKINGFKYFSANRPNKMLEYISSQYCASAPVQTIDISSNINKAKYKFNNEDIIDNAITLKSFKNRDITIEAKQTAGYKFKHWEIISSAANSELIPMGSEWRYWDKNSMPAENWHTNEYDDTLWGKGRSQLGYGERGEVTKIGYGDDANNKNPTAYFRKSVNIDNIDSKNNFSITTFVDDGAAVYVNGTEVGRFNMPEGNLSFSTFSTTYNNGEYASFNVNKNILKEGENLIAVEVHQINATSSDLIFNLKLDCSMSVSNEIQEEPIISTKLTDNLKIEAIYEESEIVDPYDGVKIHINEIVASNNQIKDENGETDDYIELYNSNDFDVNIAEWYLTDLPSNTTLAKIPATDLTKTNIPAKGRIIIWADGQPGQGVLHVNFSLSKDGETIVLSRRNPFDEIIEVDAVTYPSLEQNKSYSRRPDGTDNWVIQSPTFDKPNTDVSSVNEIHIHSTVYPTLVENSFVIENGEGSAKIVDLTGKVLIHIHDVLNRQTIDISQLQQGIYFVVLNNQSFKILKI